MCMKGTTEGCVLLERMAKVEVRQNIIMLIVVLMFLTVVFMAFKMLNAQIYLLTGGDGLREISTETRSDVKAVKQISGAIARRIVCPVEAGDAVLLQALGGLHGQLHLLLVQLHRGEEIAVPLQRLLHRLHGARQLLT